MAFNSLKFAIFFISITLVFYIIPKRYKWIALLASNFYFYMYFNPKYIVVVVFLSLVTYICGLIIEKKSSNFVRRFFLILCILSNVGTLFMFKYFKFFSSILAETRNIIIPWTFNFLIPLGISFFTLQLISYIVDVYKKNIHAERKFHIFLCYVTFFTTISSGPIERSKRFLPQLHKKIEFNYANVVDGLRIFTWGLLKKVVIADRLGEYVNSIYNNPVGFKGLPLIIATVFYAFQLYCDFSGYTDMAIGLAKIMGFDIMKNFDLPYFSKNVTEFWRRWHISLSSWLRDYVYIPLGGSRVPTLVIYLNTMIVFLVSGIWHGSNYTFIIWGLLHGIYIVFERITRTVREKLGISFNYNNKIYRYFCVLKTFILVDFAWIFFRANSYKDAQYIISNMFVNLGKSVQAITKDPIIMIINVCLILILLIAEGFMYKGFNIKKQNIYLRWGLYYLAVMIIALFGVFGNSQFIYANF